VPSPVNWSREETEGCIVVKEAKKVQEDGTGQEGERIKDKIQDG